MLLFNLLTTLEKSFLGKINFKLINNFQNLGITTDLLTFPGDGHCPWDASTSKMNQVISLVSDFVYQNLDCEESTSLFEDTTESINLIYQTNLLGQNLTNQSSGFIFSVYENGKIEKKYILNK